MSRIDTDTDTKGLGIGLFDTIPIFPSVSGTYHRVRNIRSAKSSFIVFEISHVSVKYTYLIFKIGNQSSKSIGQTKVKSALLAAYPQK